MGGRGGRRQTPTFTRICRSCEFIYAFLKQKILDIPEREPVAPSEVLIILHRDSETLYAFPLLGKFSPPLLMANRSAAGLPHRGGHDRREDELEGVGVPVATSPRGSLVSRRQNVKPSCHSLSHGQGSPARSRSALPPARRQPSSGSAGVELVVSGAGGEARKPDTDESCQRGADRKRGRV